jgi:hypothetical protein
MFPTWLQVVPVVEQGAGSALRQLIGHFVQLREREQRLELEQQQREQRLEREQLEQRLEREQLEQRLEREQQQGQQGQREQQRLVAHFQLDLLVVGELQWQIGIRRFVLEPKIQRQDH